MKRNLIATLVLMAGGLFAQNGGGYGPGYDDGQYDPGYNDQGYVAQAPPVAPMYRYQQLPPMPGPGFVWIDGYWSFMRGRYVWVGGYWTRPPFVGGYWRAPRYSGGRFFAGFWAGRNSYMRGGYGSNRGRYSSGPVRRSNGNAYRYNGRASEPSRRGRR